MIELCGATLVPGTIDVGGTGDPGRRPRRPHDPLARGARAGDPRDARPPRAPARDPRTRSTSKPPTPRMAWTSPCLPCVARTSPARSDLIEEVARIDGLEKLPATLPPPPARGPAHPRPAPAPRAPWTRSSGAGCTRPWAGASPPASTLSDCGSPEQDPPPRRCWCPREPALRGAVAAAHHAARLAARQRRATTHARGHTDLRIFEVGHRRYRPRPRPARGAAHPPARAPRAGGAAQRPRRAPQAWRAPIRRAADVFAVKGAARSARRRATRARSSAGPPPH